MNLSDSYNPSENEINVPHKFISLCSQFIYELTHLDAISPSEETVHTWLEAIGEKLGVVIRNTARLSHILARRARYVVGKKFQGGRQRATFLQGFWKLLVRVDELNLHHQNSVLQEENHSLQVRNHSLQDENDSCRTAGLSSRTVVSS